MKLASRLRFLKRRKASDLSTASIVCLVLAHPREIICAVEFDDVGVITISANDFAFPARRPPRIVLLRLSVRPQTSKN